MTPAACPNCSGRFYETWGVRWIIGRPSIFRGQNSKKWFICGCCEFSGRSKLTYATQQEAADAWLRYRNAKGATLRGEEFFSALVEYDRRLSSPPPAAAAPIREVPDPTPQSSALGDFFQ